MPHTTCPILVRRTHHLLELDIATGTIKELAEHVEEPSRCGAPLSGMNAIVGSCGQCRATGADQRPRYSHRN